MLLCINCPVCANAPPLILHADHTLETEAWGEWKHLIDGDAISWMKTKHTQLSVGGMFKATYSTALVLYYVGCIDEEYKTATLFVS